MNVGDNMNKKGFTMIELLAVIVILACVLAIGYTSINGLHKNAKDKSEEVFINTIKDAIDIYMDSDTLEKDAKNLPYDSHTCTFRKRINDKDTDLYESSTQLTINDIINSSYHPITKEDVAKNPANDEKCNLSVPVLTVYRDSDYVYYYKLDLGGLECLKDTNVISNLPEGC